MEPEGTRDVSAFDEEGGSREVVTEGSDIWRVLERIFVEVACDIGDVRVDFSEAVIEYRELPTLVLVIQR